MERAAEVWRQVRERGIQIGHWHQYLSATLEYGRYLLEIGQPDEARPLLIEVAERGVEETSYWLAAGALELLGMTEEAEALRQRSLIEEEMLLLLAVAASIGWTTQTVLEVKQGGWWQTMVIPGFGGGS